jgi:CheY-like chemotaxis protein
MADAKENMATLRSECANRKKILVADDDPRVVELLYITLSQYGYEVLSALDGREALEVANKHKPDLAIIDVKMRKVGGFEVCETLKKNNGECRAPAILISGQCDATSRLEGL